MVEIRRDWSAVFVSRDQGFKGQGYIRRLSHLHFIFRKIISEYFCIFKLYSLSSYKSAKKNITGLKCIPDMTVE